jgi:hypothetical protein
MLDETTQEAVAKCLIEGDPQTNDGIRQRLRQGCSEEMPSV